MSAEEGTAALEVDREALLALVDRLEQVLLASDLDELEVEVGATGLLLRRPAAVASPAATGGADAATPAEGLAGEAGSGRYRPVLAPLTGIFYGSPSPGAAAYVRPGDQVHAGQVIGLIEAMKLFNEIKSDVSGRVVRLVAESGALVKARQPLIEVDPA